MNILKRFTTTVSTSFDWVISQVENHEALVNSALSEMQQAAAKARVQFARVQKDGAEMKKKQNELAHTEQLWAERALNVHGEDEKRALECVKRRNQARRDAGLLKTQIEEHGRTEKQLFSDLSLIEQRIGELKRRKNAYCARQYRTDALRSTSAEQIGLIEGVDDLFNRWELKIAQCEAYSPPQDAFEEDFLSAEEEQALKEDLAQIVSEENTKAA
jgi:phage shock protein A